jgi:hypothetical protein
VSIVQLFHLVFTGTSQEVPEDQTLVSQVVVMFWRYLRYLLRHKWYVFVECCKLGIPWRGIVHDLSKFLPSEWRPYMLTYYGPWKYDQRPDWLVAVYKMAWLLHQRRNCHHWQAWVLINDADKHHDGPLPMPDKYRREMLADWRGAGKALGKPDTKAWYKQHAENIELHPETRTWIEANL